MRSKHLNLNKYNTDKIESGYLSQYDQFFSELAEKDIHLLELGIRDGGSLLLWKDYFLNSHITGIDIKLPVNFKNVNGISIFKGSQSDIDFLRDVASKTAPDGFDIIIDDASHIGELTKKAFWYLFDNHLKSGGIYVIEDWGTGYWGDWPDGKSYSPKTSFLSNVWVFLITKFSVLRHVPYKKPIYSHMYGMVGFVKSLVDEQGASDLTRKLLKGTSKRPSRFEKIVIFPNLVFIFKSNSNRQ